MPRLIDADAFIEYLGLDEENAREENLGEIVTLEDFDRQPTAYDVDKVVGQLGKIKTDNSCKDCAYKEKCDELQEYYNPSDEVDLCALVTKELSIEIVKSGGID